MSISIEQLAAELTPLATADYVILPPLPKPVPAKPAVAKPAAAPAAEGAAPAAAAKPAAAPAAAPAPAAPPPPPPTPVQLCDFAAKGVHLDVCVRPEEVVAAAQILDHHGFAIDAVTGQDWLAQGLMEVIYDFLHFQTGERVVTRARISRAKPEIASIHKVFPGANWHERETHDMYGIVFNGHPNLSPFLLPDDADFHPLRKDYNP